MNPIKIDQKKGMLCLLAWGVFITGGFTKDDKKDKEPPTLAKPVSQPLLHFEPSKPVPEADEEKRQGSYRVDLSAAVLAPDGKTLWTAADETVGVSPSIERLTLQKDGSFTAHKSFPLSDLVKLPLHKDKDIEEGRIPETDTEGLSLDRGYLWAVGSHSLNRKQANKKDPEKNIERLGEVDGGLNRFVLIRIPLAPGMDGGPDELQKSVGDKTAALLDSTDAKGLIDRLLEDDILKYFIPQKIDPKNAEGVPSKDNGLDIEGLAVSKGRIFLGLRGPVLRGVAVILEIAVEDGDKGELKLAKLPNGNPYVRHFIKMDGCGVRDLCVDGKDLLILSGPTMDLDGPAAIYRWKGALTDSPPSTHTFQAEDAKILKRVLSLPVGFGADHPEGLALLPTPGPSGRKQVLILYDSPKNARLPKTDDYKADVFELDD